MSILELTTKLRDTSEAIALHEKAVAQQPSPALLASLKSLQNRMSRLEQEFAMLTANSGVDVCRYRFFGENSHSTVNPVCNALINFQSLVSLAFDAVTNGPKQTARVSQNIQDLTTFGIGYSFSGSLGLVLTFKNEQIDLFGSSKNDAMSAVFDLMNSRTTNQVGEYAKALGAPVVKAVHAWASDHVKYGIGADLEWIQPNSKTRIILNESELRTLVGILQETSHSETETIFVEGSLVGGEHLKRQAFHFFGDDGTDYTGRYTEEAISEDNPVQFPMRYLATMEKTVKVRYTSDDDSKPTYVLVRLRPVSKKGKPDQE